MAQRIADNVTIKGFSHIDGRCCGCIEGGAGFEKGNDFGAAVSGALNNFFDAIRGRPSHLDKIRNRNSGHR